MSHQLTCLICGWEHDSLVAIQEHCMREHDYTQDDLEKCARRQEHGDQIFTMPDGRDWLRARRTATGTIRRSS